MMIYKVGNYTFSADLERYSVCVDTNENCENPTYDIGFCSVEYVPNQIGDYTPTPMKLNASKPIEWIDFDTKSELKGRLAMQLEPAQLNVSQADEVSWLAIKIDVPNGDLDEMIRAIAKDKGVEISDKALDQTRERLLTRKSTPTKCSPATVCAMIRNTSTLKAAHYYQERVAALGEVLSIPPRQAEWLVFCDRSKHFALHDDGWHPYLMTMQEAATTTEMQLMVDKGLFELDTNGNYRNTEKATSLLKTGYLA